MSSFDVNDYDVEVYTYDSGVYYDGEGGIYDSDGEEIVYDWPSGLLRDVPKSANEPKKDPG